MQRVFAIFLFALLCVGCSSMVVPENVNLEVINDKGTFYKFSGDFDGDNDIEDINLVQDNSGKSFIKLTDGENIVIKKLDIDISNSSIHIEDTNKDHREDIIVYAVHNSVEKLYVFAYKDGIIYELLSPELLERSINFYPSHGGYILKWGDISKKVSSDDKLFLNFYYVDYDYNDDKLFFTNEGGVLNSRNEELYSICVVYYIDIHEKLQVKDIHIRDNLNYSN